MLSAPDKTAGDTPAPPRCCLPALILRFDHHALGVSIPENKRAAKEMLHVAREAAMKAVGYVESLPISDPNSLFDIEVPKPRPGGRDLLVRIEAISVNPVDTKVRMRRTGTPEAPVLLGWDAAGVVEEVGEAVSLFKPGDEV